MSSITPSVSFAGELASEPPDLDFDPMDALFEIQDAFKNDKAAKKVCLSIIVAIQELGFVGAQKMIETHRERYIWQIPEPTPENPDPAASGPPERLQAMWQLVDGLEAVVASFSEIYQKDPARARYMPLTPKLKNLVEVVTYCCLNGSACAIFVKQRAVAPCLQKTLHSQLMLNPELKGKFHIVTSLGFNSAPRNKPDDPDFALEEFRSSESNILITTTARPLLQIMTERHFLVIPFDPIPNYSKLIEDMEALHHESQESINSRAQWEKLWGPWTKAGEGIVCAHYQVIFAENNFKFDGMGVLVPGELPRITPFSIFLPKQREVEVSLRYIGHIILNPRESKDVALLHQWLVTMMSGIDVNGTTRNILLQPPSFEHFMPYYFVPLQKLTPRIEWDIVQTIITRGATYKSHPLWPHPHMISLLTDPQTILISQHNHKLLRCHTIVSGEKSFIPLNQYPVTFKGNSVSLLDYYKEKFGFSDLDPNQPVLIAADLRFKARNFLSPTSRPDDPADDEPITTQLSNHPIPLQLCHMHAAPSFFYDALQWMPSVMHRVGNWIRADRIRAKYLLRSTELVLEAITAPSTHESLNYELSELLGDAILKFAASVHVFASLPQANEGDLTTERSKLIRNSYLARLASASGIIEDVIIESFSFSSQRAAATLKRESAETINKTAADVVEAMIGAAFRDSGYKSALEVLAQLGLPLIQTTRLNGEPLPIAPERGNQLRQLESILRYKFRQPGLLHRALTHGTVLAGANQRLEFLGDAVLDFLVTKDIMYRTQFAYSQGEYTLARSDLVNNEAFSLIASELLSLQTYVVASARFTRVNDFLSDCFEALVGAIFIDCECDTSVVWSVLQSIFAERIENVCERLNAGLFRRALSRTDTPTIVS